MVTHYTTNATVISCIETRTFLSIKRQNDALQNAFPDQWDCECEKHIFIFCWLHNRPLRLFKCDDFSSWASFFLGLFILLRKRKEYGGLTLFPFFFFQGKHLIRKLNSKAKVTSLLWYHILASHPSDLSRQTFKWNPESVNVHPEAERSE